MSVACPLGAFPCILKSCAARCRTIDIIELDRKWRDIAAAEDALADAFATALERWPRDGVPAFPEAWLLTVAKRNWLQLARRQRQANDSALRALFPADEAVIDAPHWR